ncbi:MAG TPA: hypothetical protein ENH29_01095 [Bacteroidetes bacterium]|nr:hypothetical protein [Bacteroidota bacterium]
MKIALIYPQFQIHEHWLTPVSILLSLGIVVYFFIRRGKIRKNKNFWLGLFILFIAGQFYGESAAIFHLLPFWVLGWLKTKSKPDENDASREVPGEKEIRRMKELSREKKLLEKRILETSETFYSQVQFFESLLTLNEIQLMQSIVESTTKFLRANRVSFYQYNSVQNEFMKTASFHYSAGLSLPNERVTDKVLFLIKQSQTILSIREIVHNKLLYKLWQKSNSKALIYGPVFSGKRFIGILAIEEINFFRLHRQTIKNVGGLCRLIALAIRNVRSHQKIISERNLVQSKLLTEYQQFLKTLNFEFKRANRNDLQLSLIYVVFEGTKQRGADEKTKSSLTRQIKKNCQKNLREIDLFFDDDEPGRFWVLLPMTDFNGLAYVLERLNLLVSMDLASQADYICHLGFSSLDHEIKHPKQMIETCKESYRLHRKVRSLLNKQRELF